MFLVKNRKYIGLGILASLSLLVFYFLVFFLLDSLTGAWSQFQAIQYWVLPLVAGFGFQAGLYFFVRDALKRAPTAMVSSSGVVSAGAMVVCCLHHLADVLPLLGLAAAAVFLTKYQEWFFILAIFSNLIGVAMMLRIIKKHNLWPKK